MIVVDSNIIFSCLLKNNKFFNFIIDSEENFIIPKFAIVEIFKYKEKIAKYSKLKEDEILEVFYKILKKIDIYDENLISVSSYKKAYEIVKDIDEKDVVFIALCIEFNAKLLTGDKKLIEGLINKGFDNLVLNGIKTKDKIGVEK
jgi:predicted nucleic acid-binding protein